MDSFQDRRLFKGSLLSDVLTMKPDLIEQMALFLDREMRLIPNWKHFSNELKVDVNVISRLEQYADFSPTIRLFEYLETAQPNLSIQRLKQAFLDIRRHDLFSLLKTTAALSDSELVSEAITSRHPVAPSPNVRLLDEIALKLDVQSMTLANWSSLAVKLGVPRQTFKLFERRSTQSPTNQLFEYLGSTCPQMTVKTLDEALTKMERKDLLEILHEKSPQGEIFIKDVMPPGSELLQMVADKLDTAKVPWEKNWLHLAYFLQIPSDVYQGFETREQRKSPTMEVIRWLVVHSSDITLIDIVKALEIIQRNNVIQIITQHFPDTVNSFLEQPSSLLNSNMSFDQPSATLSSRRDHEFTCGTFFKPDYCRRPGHCGSLPDPPYVLKGREVNCEEIIKSLLSNKAVEVVAPPGYGKTSVVVETAHRLIKYHGKYVAYVNPRGVTCVEDLGVTIIEALGEVPGDNTIRETLHRIRSLRAKNMVLVIENLDNLLHLEDNQERESDLQGVEYCPKMRGKNTKEDFLNFISEIGQTKKICLVLTSTEINDFSVCFPIDIIKLLPLSETESSELFKERDMTLDEDTIKKLVVICGGIPLIICTVLSILRIRNPHNFTRRLSTCTPRELLQELSPDYLQRENRIDLCLEVCFHRLSEENQEVLTKLSTFPHRFTQEQFYTVFSQPKTDREKLEMCLNSLKHTSLLRFERESCYFCIHPFIRKFCSVHNQSTHKQAKLTFIRHYSDVVIALSKKFLSRESKCAIDEYRSERENIKEATAWCEGEHHDLPSEVTDHCIDAFIKAAVFLAKVMRKQEFESLFCKLSQNYRYDSKRHSACLTAVGTKIVLSCTCTPHICYRAWYRAKRVLSRANEVQLVETVDDATRAQCLSKLGFILVREGQHTEGFEYLCQALALRNKRWEQSKEDMDKVMIGACRNDIAASLMIQRKHLAAIETRRNFVLPLYESILGKDHAFVATTLSWIGKSYHELGEYDNAIKYATLALNIRQTLLGRHQETARSHYDLGVAFSAKKDSKRALEHLQHAIALQEQVLDTHEELVLSHQETAVVLEDLGNKEEAEREMERACECAKRLDVLEVPLQTLNIHEEEGWQKTDPVLIGSTLRELVFKRKSYRYST